MRANRSSDQSLLATRFLYSSRIYKAMLTRWVAILGGHSLATIFNISNSRSFASTSLKSLPLDSAAMCALNTQTNSQHDVCSLGLSGCSVGIIVFYLSFKSIQVYAVSMYLFRCWVNTALCSAMKLFQKLISHESSLLMSSFWQNLSSSIEGPSWAAVLGTLAYLSVAWYALVSQLLRVAREWPSKASCLSIFQISLVDY